MARGATPEWAGIAAVTAHGVAVVALLALGVVEIAVVADLVDFQVGVAAAQRRGVGRAGIAQRRQIFYLQDLCAPNKIIIEWGGQGVPEQMKELPQGRYVLVPADALPLTEEAERDLEGSVSYLLERNPRAAAALIDKAFGGQAAREDS